MAALQFLWCLLAAFFASCRCVEGASVPYQEKKGCKADVEANSMLQLKDEIPKKRESCIRYSFTFPLMSNGRAFKFFILRLYSPSVTTASIPTVSWPLKTSVFEDALAEAASGSYRGALEDGCDQYAIYYAGFSLLNLTKRKRIAKLNATVSGFFPNVAYSSLQLMYGPGAWPDLSMLEVAASSYITTGTLGQRGTPNPFIAGSPTVLAYTHQAECVTHATTFLATPKRQTGSSRGRMRGLADVACKDTNTKLYRLSADMTVLVMADSATGSCSDSYLISPAQGVVATYPDQDFSNVDVYNFSWGFIRMRVPFVFNNSGEKIYQGSYSADNSDGYDVNYWSVSANVAQNGRDPNVPFTVNALMMQEQERMMTSTGHSYVLFAPMDFVINMTAANSTTPPKVNLPKLGISAYVLAAPSYAFIFRYKVPSPDWPGSTENVPCAATTAEMNSSVANCETLGNWAPQITRIGEGEGVETLAQLASVVQGAVFSHGKQHK
ncbi:unnamed protein product [Polarella glacialis]|uniref:Uncharacterized protein n=1 Tax=Polarella glacialis TaxID=89957 RepID=A0A813KH31_POLGL|nr:unnamed protein product [Polarella glacialis]